MLRLLERNIASVHERLVVLPPPRAALVGPACFGNVTADSQQRSALLHELQRLRGRVYLGDGAIEADQLLPDGRHRTPEDENSWHLLIVDDQRRVTGCIWYLEHAHTPTLEQLRVRECPLARQEIDRTTLRAAVEADIARARREGVRYAEVGGWAVAKESRLSDCLLLVLSLCSLSRIFGGALVIATATVRHSSAAILRRMGGSPLQADGVVVPAYYDRRFKCEMELLRFDTRRPSARFERLVACIRGKFAFIPVIACDRHNA